METCGSRRVQLFLATEQCVVSVSADDPVTLRRSDDPRVLFLNDPTVSSRAEGAATLRLNDDRLEILPADGATPILLNGSRLHGATELRSGDRLRLGYTTLVVQGLQSAADGELGEVRTLALATEFLRQREPLEAAADRLAWWSQSFEAMLHANDPEAFARVVLRQLAELCSASRGVFAWGDPPRELASLGLTAAEVERILAWLPRQAAGDGVLTPSLDELLGSGEAARAIVVRSSDRDDIWWLACDAGGDAGELEAAYRVRSVLASLLGLHRSLHTRQLQDRRVAELTETVRRFAQPAEAQLYEIVRVRFVHRSEAMRRVCRELSQAAPAPCPVLLLGEPGTGKQLAAEALHAASQRGHREMITVSLVEIPETLMESQLFGHVARIFSGAREHRGLLARADGSTLFLDEIGEVPLGIQAKLLRVLETGQFWQIGASRPQRVDLRLVTATNRDLAEMVRRGEFRQDLYDRISVIPITLPPLREHREDILSLIEHFLEEFNLAFGRRVSFAADGLELLQGRGWRNNVRGLRRFVERAVVMAGARSRCYAARELGELLPEETPAEESLPRESAAGSLLDELQAALLEQGRANQSQILRQLRLARGRRSKTEWAEQVGLSRPVFRRELKGLIRCCVERGLPVEFFQERVKLQEQDLTFVLGGGAQRDERE